VSSAGGITNSSYEKPQLEVKEKVMNIRKIFAIAIALILVSPIALRTAHADTWNQETQVTFNQPVEIPGTVLAAGTYWFVLANDDSNRNIVQIFSADRSVLYATVQTVASERRHAADEVTLTLAERPSGYPEAILAWFYPGQAIGHEFLYPGNEEKELSRDVHQNFPTEAAGPAGYAGGH
jgi:hypothetical protein